MNPLFSDQKFHNIGVAAHKQDFVKMAREALKLVRTGDDMHDGSLATLWDVMDHCNKGGVPNPYLDGGMQRLGLTEPEIDDLVAFLALEYGKK